MTENQSHADAQGDAIDWLVGRLRWERILRELHDQADGVAPTAFEAPAKDDQAA